MMSSDDDIVKSLFETGKYTSVHSCKKCPYITKSMFFIRNHIKRHKNTNSLKLFDCAQSTPEIFLCPECNFSTYDTITFTSHLKDHRFQAFLKKLENQVRSDVSEVDKIVPPLNNLYPTKPVHKTHPKQHSFYIDEENVKWYHCDECAYSAKTKHALTRHIYNRHTSSENIRWFRCNECEFKAKCKTNLKRHIVYRHTPSENIKWFQCDQCVYKTKKKANLERHVDKMHTSLGWFHCEKCDYKTKRKEQLNSHIKTYSFGKCRLALF